MFIKLQEVGKEGIDVFDNHLFEADHIHYRWQEEYPDAIYFVPFGRRDDVPEDGSLMVISLYDRGSLTEEIVTFNCAVYIMNEKGKTVDKFAV